MKVVFISNYFSHHQRPLSEALNNLCDYTFIATQQIPEERKKLGWSSEADDPAYVVHSSEARQDSLQKLLREADLVIAGSAPESLFRERIREGRLLFRYSERPLKHGTEALKYVPRFLKWHFRNPVGKPIYLLCASAYAAGDYQKFLLFRNRSFCWGYFPRTIQYDDPEALIRSKDPQKILWCGRFLDWKHPDDLLLAARILKEKQIPFFLDFIGAGDLCSQLQRLTEEMHLEDCVHFPGAMSPDLVRRRMEGAGICVVSSDRQEGWGAVVNESMNSGCALVASHAVGAVPFLMKHEENGLIYPSGKITALANCLEILLKNPAKQRKFGFAAYRTITEEWNAEVAARRILILTEAILSGETKRNLFLCGPASPAPVLDDRFWSFS